MAPTAFDNDDRVSRRESMRARIVDLAVSGDLPPDTLTSENELAERLAAGRTPVREAVALLASEGLFVQVPQKGIRLRRVSLEDAKGVLAIRRRVEGLVVETLAHREDRSARFSRGAELLGKMSSADPERFWPAYEEFHLALARAAGFGTAVFSLRTYIDVLRLFFAHREKKKLATSAVQTVKIVRDELAMAVQNVKIVLEELAILGALEKGDSVRAGEAFSSHIDETLRRLDGGRGPAERRLPTKEPAVGAAMVALARSCAKEDRFAQAGAILGTKWVSEVNPKEVSAVQKQFRDSSVFLRALKKSRSHRGVAFKTVGDVEDLVSDE